MGDINQLMPVPKILDREYTKPLLLGTGPSDFWPSVSEALTKPSITPMCEEFYRVLDDIRAGIQYLFQTKSKLVLAMTGSGHIGMEAAICNLVYPGETLLIASRGTWDARAFEIARRYDIKTVVITAPPTETFKLDQLEETVKKVRPHALYITHGDSSTGSVQQIEGLGQICHKYGALLLVDSVISIGGVRYLMDEWEVDASFAATQKGLSGPAGIAPVAFSAGAEDKINKRSHDPPFYFDIKLLALQWNCYGDTRKYHHTLSSPMLWALRACLQEIVQETLPKAWRRHQSTIDHFYKRLQGLPVQFYISNPEDRLNTVTTIVLPAEYDHTEFTNYMRNKCVLSSTLLVQYHKEKWS